jgi:hypothetical protein
MMSVHCASLDNKQEGRLVESHAMMEKRIFGGLYRPSVKIR